MLLRGILETQDLANIVLHTCHLTPCAPALNVAQKENDLTDNVDDNDGPSMVNPLAKMISNDAPATEMVNPIQGDDEDTEEAPGDST